MCLKFFMELIEEFPAFGAILFGILFDVGEGPASLRPHIATLL